MRLWDLGRRIWVTRPACINSGRGDLLPRPSLWSLTLHVFKLLLLLSYYQYD